MVSLLMITGDIDPSPSADDRFISQFQTDDRSVIAEVNERISLKQSFSHAKFEIMNSKFQI
jgi:hypothetical protein